MKILNSYKKIAKEFIKEAAWDRKFGEPLPTLSTVVKEFADDEKQDQDASGRGRDDGDTWMAPNGDYGGKHNGEIQYFGDEEQAKVYAKSGSKDGKGGEEKPEEPKGKALGGSDFDRDFDDDEPKDEPKDEPSGEPTDKPKDITGSIAGDEDAKEFAQALAQDLETNRSYQGLKDAGHEDLAKAIYHADSEEEKFDLVRKALEEPDEPKGKSSGSKEKIEKEIEQITSQIQDEVDSMDPDEDYIGKLVKKRDELEDMLDSMGESITINGKQYIPIKESKEPTKPTIHQFKKTYKRIGGK